MSERAAATLQAFVVPPEAFLEALLQSLFQTGLLLIITPELCVTPECLLYYLYWLFAVTCGVSGG